jgi:uncharacterized protein YggU (UPF0235/DUF167 family)
VRRSVEGVYGEDSIRMKVAAPLVDGGAKLLDLRKSDVEVVRGASSRDKRFSFSAATSLEVERTLSGRL